VLLKRLDGYKLEQFETSRHSGRSGQKVLVVLTDDTLDRCAFERYGTLFGRMALRTDGCPDDMTHRPDG
jgi:hypothetical protein